MERKGIEGPWFFIYSDARNHKLWLHFRRKKLFEKQSVLMESLSLSLAPKLPKKYHPPFFFRTEIVRVFLLIAVRNYKTLKILFRPIPNSWSYWWIIFLIERISNVRLHYVELGLLFMNNFALPIPYFTSYTVLDLYWVTFYLYDKVLG